VTNRSLAQPAPQTTRETIARKALRLYPERTVEPLGHGRYSVEGSDGFYEVDLGIDGGEESCPCIAHKPCYHISLATIYRAKSRAKARREQHQRTASRAAHASLAPLAAAL
jgi:hypothetical protein